jgi:hypothetical protein
LIDSTCRRICSGISLISSLIPLRSVGSRLWVSQRLRTTSNFSHAQGCEPRESCSPLPLPAQRTNRECAELRSTKLNR